MNEPDVVECLPSSTQPSSDARSSIMWPESGWGFAAINLALKAIKNPDRKFARWLTPRNSSRGSRPPLTHGKLRHGSSDSKAPQFML